MGERVEQLRSEVGVAGGQQIAGRCADLFQRPLPGDLQTDDTIRLCLLFLEVQDVYGLVLGVHAVKRPTHRRRTRGTQRVFFFTREEIY